MITISFNQSRPKTSLGKTSIQIFLILIPRLIPLTLIPGSGSLTSRLLKPGWLVGHVVDGGGFGPWVQAGFGPLSVIRANLSVFDLHFLISIWESSIVAFLRICRSRSRQSSVTFLFEVVRSPTSFCEAGWSNLNCEVINFLILRLHHLSQFLIQNFWLTKSFMWDD